MRKNLKYIIIISIILVSILVLIVYRNSHSSTLIIQVAPTSATINIDGETYENGIYNVVPKNDVQATISYDGFEDKQVTLQFIDGETTVLNTYLHPENNDWSFYEKEENSDSLLILTSISDNNGEINNLTKKLSLMSIVPISFSVCGEPATRMNCDSISVEYNYYDKCDNSLCVKISGRKEDLDQTTLNTVKEKLAEKGYNLKDYQYFYSQVAN